MTDWPSEDPASQFNADEPKWSSEDRDRMAEERDRNSDSRDQVAVARDGLARERDVVAETREHTSGGSDPGAAADRARAEHDRQGSAEDRLDAHHNRDEASMDRATSARERQRYLIDGLTGARRRDAGLLELEREIIRAKRTQRTFVLAFIDVDALKATNDVHGHAAGDLLLAQVASTIRRHLRAYDLIVRYGGDEFLCGLLDLTIDDAATRFARVNTVLADEYQASVTAGLAELNVDDQLQDVIDRADAALYDERQRRTTPAT
jgi:diguanylate cyclase (GGDEF)-like protein